MPQLALKCAAGRCGKLKWSGRISRKTQPRYLEFKDLVSGIKDTNGNAAGGPVIGHGHFIMKHLSSLDKDTGKGQPGPYWTVGAQAVEIEYDRAECTFRLIRAATVLDAGHIICPECALGQVTGAMNIGLSNATRESYQYSPQGELKDTSFRTYKVMHFAENPKYVVEFIETPNISGPYGARGLGEHGIMGMPPALANALGKAAGVQLDALPITYESLWYAVTNSSAGSQP